MSKRRKKQNRCTINDVIKIGQKVAFLSFIISSSIFPRFDLLTKSANRKTFKKM